MNADDQLAIINLVIQADQLATKRDANNYVLLFASNGSMTGKKSDVSGRDDLLTTVQKVWSSEPNGTLHLTIAPQVQPISATKATATSTLLILNSNTNQIISNSQVTHQLIKENNTWFFTNRNIQ